MTSGWTYGSLTFEALSITVAVKDAKSDVSIG